MRSRLTNEFAQSRASSHMFVKNLEEPEGLPDLGTGVAVNHGFMTACENNKNSESEWRESGHFIHSSSQTVLGLTSWTPNATQRGSSLEVWVPRGSFMGAWVRTGRDKYLIMCIKHAPALPSGESLSLSLSLCWLHKGPSKREENRPAEVESLPFLKACRNTKHSQRTPSRYYSFQSYHLKACLQDISVQLFIHYHFNENDSFVLALFCHKWETLPVLMLKSEVTLEALRVLCHLPNKSFGNILDFTKVVTTCLYLTHEGHMINILAHKSCKAHTYSWLMESGSSYPCLSFYYFLNKWKNLEIFLVLVYLKNK